MATTRAITGGTIDALVTYANEANPWVLAVGRVGIDQGADDIGSTTDNLLRKSPVNLLVASQVFSPTAAATEDVRASAK